MRPSNHSFKVLYNCLFAVDVKLSKIVVIDKWNTGIWYVFFKDHNACPYKNVS